MAAAANFPPVCRPCAEVAFCFAKRLQFCCRYPPCSPTCRFCRWLGVKRQSLAGTAGCPGNTLCHRSGLEQELAYPCQSAGRIWAMPCVNRLSDFHSDGSGIGPTPPLAVKATPASLFLKAPRALLSSPISCLNYALLCAALVFFFFLPSCFSAFS